jgi:hypothetical protein
MWAKVKESDSRRYLRELLGRRSNARGAGGAQEKGKRQAAE